MSNHFETQRRLALQKELEDLKRDYDLARAIGTKAGFIQYYYKQLPNYKTHLETFTAINNKYYDVFGEFRYQNYGSFSVQLTRYLKRK